MGPPKMTVQSHFTAAMIFKTRYELLRSGKPRDSIYVPPRHPAPRRKMSIRTQFAVTETEIIRLGKLLQLIKKGRVGKKFYEPHKTNPF